MTHGNYRDALDGYARIEEFWRDERRKHGKHGSPAVAQYANGWSSAADIATLRRQYDVREANARVKMRAQALDYPVNPFEAFMEQMHGAITEELRHSAICYVAAPIVALLNETSATLPDVTLTRDLPNAPRGVIWLADPIPLMPAMSEEQRDRYIMRERDFTAHMTDAELRRIPDRLAQLRAVLPFSLEPRLRALAWHPIICFQKDDHELRERLALAFYMDYRTLDFPGRVAGIAEFGYDWGTTIDYGDKLWDAEVRAIGEPGLQIGLRFLAAAWLFMRQRIVVAEPTTLTNRGARRALEQRIQRPAPDVQVINLRRREVAHEENIDDAERERRRVAWSCQWAVRGHWRQQYYRSRGTHEPRFILPYVKGPSDKPLRVQRTVIALAR